jgi:hypothetical protein
MKRLALKRAEDRQKRLLRKSEREWKDTHLRWMIAAKNYRIDELIEQGKFDHLPCDGYQNFGEFRKHQ